MTRLKIYPHKEKENAIIGVLKAILKSGKNQTITAYIKRKIKALKTKQIDSVCKNKIWRKKKKLNICQENASIGSRLIFIAISCN